MDSRDQPDMLADFGAYLRAQREIAQISLRSLSRMSKVSDSYLSQIERGKYQPSPDVVRNIAAGLNLDPNALFRRMGWLQGSDSNEVGVIEAIASDSRLTGQQKTALVQSYKAMVGDD